MFSIAAVLLTALKALHQFWSSAPSNEPKALLGVVDLSAGAVVYRNPWISQALSPADATEMTHACNAACIIEYDNV